MSMPISFIMAIASGRTFEGFVPAENTSNLSPASCRHKPSAIWLRAEFPVQRISMRFRLFMLKPKEEEDCRRRSHKLCGDESGHVERTNSGESIGEGTRERYGRIRE